MSGSRNGQRGGIIFRFLAFMVFLLMLAALYTVRHPLMRMAARFWVVSDLLQRSDLIVVLGDDNFTGDRAARAADLFRAGLAPRVVASGRKLRASAGVAELIEHDLINDGVPESAVSAFAHQASSTEEEAQALEKYVAMHNWRRVIVVTSNYHTRRARYIFDKVFPAGTSVMVASAPDSDFDPRSWWISRRGQEFFLHEVIGYFLAMWDLRHAPAAS